MLTYEYRCLACGITISCRQKIIDAPLVKCPQCGGNLVRLITGGTGVIFKGRGFYMNDYHGGLGSSWGKVVSDPRKTNHQK